MRNPITGELIKVTEDVISENPDLAGGRLAITVIRIFP